MNDFPDNFDEFLQDKLGAALYRDAQWQGSPDKLWQGMESRLYMNRKEWKKRLIIHLIMAIALIILYIIVCRYPIGEYLNQREEYKLYQKYGIHVHHKPVTKNIQISNIPVALLIEDLKRTGLEVGDNITDTHTYLIYSNGKNIKINKEFIKVFEYENSDAAENAALGISKDGYSIRGWSVNNIPKSSNITKAYIEWSKPPHFYKINNLIILYVGRNSRIIHTLEKTLGSPFAGRKENILYRIFYNIFSSTPF
jgi:hypothetical protein